MCIRVGIGHDLRTTRNWIFVAMTFGLIEKDAANPNVNAFARGPRFDEWAKGDKMTKSPSDSEAAQ